MQLVKAGANRQEMHAILRKQALLAWEVVQQGGTNPLIKNLVNDQELNPFLTAQEIQQIMQQGSSYTGDAAYLARKLADRVRTDVEQYKRTAN